MQREFTILTRYKNGRHLSCELRRTSRRHFSTRYGRVEIKERTQFWWVYQRNTKLNASDSITLYDFSSQSLRMIPLSCEPSTSCISCVSSHHIYTMTPAQHDRFYEMESMP